jgi:hypothetical protein
MVKWIKLASTIIPMIVSAIHWVEQWASEKESKQKQDAAVEVVQTLLGISSEVSGRELISDDRVESIVRQIIDLVVLLENTVAEIRGNTAPST